MNVTEYDTVDIAVQDTDLAAVLQMLSIQSQKNIITSKSVSATVTANLYDVTFYEALDAILRVNGYRYAEEGNFIYIYTQDEYEAIEASRLRRESRIFEVDYLAAVDAHEFITPLLSEGGTSSYRGDVEAGYLPDISNGGADSYAYSAKIVVNDYPEILDRIAEMLEELDTPPHQVLVEATIVQTTLDEANAFGEDFTILQDLDFTDLTAPLDAVDNLLNGSDPNDGYQPPDNKAFAGTSTVGTTSGPAGLKVGIITNDVSVFIRVLDEVTDSSVLARPKVMTLNRQRAEVLVGRRVGYLSTTATETTTTQTVEFLDTGIQLVLRPFISQDGSIRMELAPSVSEAELRNVTDATGSVVTIPDEVTSEVTTNVRMKDGQTLVLGGLFRESNTVTRRQIPWLGDIPLLGAAFRGQDDTVKRTEIIFLITPSIIHDEALWELGKDAMAYSDLVQIGARNGLLPFSNSRLTAGYNQDAIDAYNRGDTDEALYYLNNSLRLNRNQPEMVRLRQLLNGDKYTHFERSFLERVLRNKLGPVAVLPHNVPMTRHEGLTAPAVDASNPDKVPFDGFSTGNLPVSKPKTDTDEMVGVSESDDSSGR
ncbi:MAG: hypothetical protein ACYTGG_00275 [Planctomycetota bacterium]